jgi:hypothetical protein
VSPTTVPASSELRNDGNDHPGVLMSNGSMVFLLEGMRVHEDFQL